MTDVIRLNMNVLSDQRYLEVLILQSQEKQQALSAIVDVYSGLVERQQEMRNRLTPPQPLPWWKNPR